MLFLAVWEWAGLYYGELTLPNPRITFQTLARLSMTASMMSRPIVTVLIGTPPIVWLVLALLWFGNGDGTPIFTVFVACMPVVFVGAMQGARTLDGQHRGCRYSLPSAAIDALHRYRAATCRILSVSRLDHGIGHLVESRRDG